MAWKGSLCARSRRAVLATRGTTQFSWRLPPRSCWNLLLWRPFDPSVLAGSSSEDGSALKVTSAIQTFLDLKKLAGRGEEAAAAVYDRLLAGPLRDAAQRSQEARA